MTVGARLRAPGLRAALSIGRRACRRLVAAYVVTAVLAGVAPVVSVWLISRVADALVRAGGAGVIAPAIGLAAVGLVSSALQPVQQYLFNEVNRRTARAAQDELYAATERIVGLGPFEDPQFSDRLRMAQLGGRSAPSQAVDGSLGLLQGLITIVGLAVVLAAISPLVTVVALLAAVPGVVAELRVSRQRADVTLSVSPNERREFFYAGLLTGLDAAKEVRLLGLGGLFRRRMTAELGAADGARRRVDLVELRTQFALAVLAVVVSGVGLVWVVLGADGGRLAVGDVLAYIVGIAALQGAVSVQVSRLAVVHQAVSLFGHFRYVTSVGADLPVATTPRALPALSRGITLRDVWFRYGTDGPWVLRGVDLHIPHGSSTAIVGANGAGKSTLIKLLCRFYDPDRGEIRWDGVDLRDVDPVDLRERIGAVFQDYLTFDLTVAENVGLGDVTVLGDRARIRAAAERAGVDGVLAALPHGYDTLLSRIFEAEESGEGVLLSGGQWQRLALARAFMRDRRDLLILDEPSSGLDARAEFEISARLRTHRAGRTSVLISHRLGSIRDADRIVVLQDGRITECGRHEELLAQPVSVYADLFAMQAQGYRDAEPLLCD